METLHLDSPSDDSCRWGSPPIEDHVGLRNLHPAQTFIGEPVLPLMCLDAAILGDIPARYIISCVPDNEFPAMGVYVDNRIVPGFRYKVRVLPDPNDLESKSKYLFGGRALILDSIGRGYSRRLTFESDEDRNNNENYFWTDSSPGGFALELEVLTPGDSFLILDSEGASIGELEVVDIMDSQEEMTQVLTSSFVEKSVKVNIRCKISWLDWRVGTSISKISCIAECVKKKNERRGEVRKIYSDDLLDSCKHHAIIQPKKQFFKTQIFSDTALSTSYSVCGLRFTEYPVIGTYVSPKILPGFKYKVRRLPENEYLFNGRPLRLSSIGMGYGKRLSFEPDTGCTNEPNNYFWSDSSPEGYAFQPIACEVGQVMKITLYGCILGQVEIVRLASVHKDVHTAMTSDGVEKVFEVDLICKVKLQIGTCESFNMRICGTAILLRKKKTNCADIVSIKPSSISIEENMNLSAIRTILMKGKGVELVP